jgi:hypothetical protein
MTGSYVRAMPERPSASMQASLVVAAAAFLVEAL